MRKFFTIAFAFAILLSLLSVPAYALTNDQMTQQTNVRKNDGTPLNSFIPNDVTNTNNYRTNNVTNDRMNNNRTNNVTNDRMNNYGLDGNNYRATAVDNNRDFNWSWLGLLGLAGLFGLRNRERERS